MGRMDEVDPGLGTAIQEAVERGRGLPSHDTAANREVAMLHTRAVYAAAELQGASSDRIESLTKGLVKATAVLAGATIALVFSTIVLVIITAAS